MKPPIDVIGKWSELKLEIIQKYAKAYTTALKNQQFERIYIDGFAGAGISFSKTTKEMVEGSPLRVLNVDPPFSRYYFIESNRKKLKILNDIVRNHKFCDRVNVIEGDSNVVLPSEVFQKVQWRDNRRALCLLDPYNMDELDWNLISKTGKMRTIDLLLHFPIQDMNRNALRRNPNKVENSQKTRMNRYWGDASWQEDLYHKIKDLFQDTRLIKKSNGEIVRIFQKRLVNVAGFKYVPDPIPMRNETRSIIYYLFFATQKELGNKIADSIFKRYR